MTISPHPPRLGPAFSSILVPLNFPFSWSAPCLISGRSPSIAASRARALGARLARAFFLRTRRRRRAPVAAPPPRSSAKRRAPRSPQLRRAEKRPGPQKNRGRRNGGRGVSSQNGKRCCKNGLMSFWCRFDLRGLPSLEEPPEVVGKSEWLCGDFASHGLAWLGVVI